MRLRSVPGFTDQVGEVLVNDNDFVEKGTMLVRLDRQPFADHGGTEAFGPAPGQSDRRAARGGHWRQPGLNSSRLIMMFGPRWPGCTKPGRPFRGVRTRWRFRIASLRAEVAGLRATQASLALAQREYDRVTSWSRSNPPLRRSSTNERPPLTSAREQVKAADAEGAAGPRLAGPRARITSIPIRCPPIWSEPTPTSSRAVAAGAADPGAAWPCLSGCCEWIPPGWKSRSRTW